MNMSIISYELLILASWTSDTENPMTSTKWMIMFGVLVLSVCPVIPYCKSSCCPKATRIVYIMEGPEAYDCNGTMTTDKNPCCSVRKCSNQKKCCGCKGGCLNTESED
ncbi:uncharacterized protein [Bemisia tabaci]|uniref:uncharacterized protein isoform X2 n=1 Tax=Bemisia tabaci TaxID=7038 RepID=UPI003B27BE3B